jgi:hypothetical protein
VALVCERNIPAQPPPLVGEVSTNFCEWRVLRSQPTDPYCRILGFLDRSCRVDPVPDPLLLRKSGSAVNLTRDLWICSPGTLTTRPQRRSTFFCITYIKSVRTSQETQYICILQPGTLTTRPQRRSTFFCISYINSVCTSQEAQYISDL